MNIKVFLSFLREYANFAIISFYFKVEMSQLTSNKAEFALKLFISPNGFQLFLISTYVH